MIKGPGSSSTVDETDTPLVSGKEKTGIPSPTLSRGANGLGGLPVSLAVAIEVSFSLLYYPPPRHAPIARQFDFVIFTASIGGSISTEPHLAVPNRWPAPFIRDPPSPAHERPGPGNACWPAGRYPHLSVGPLDPDCFAQVARRARRRPPPSRRR